MLSPNFSEPLQQNQESAWTSAHRIGEQQGRLVKSSLATTARPVLEAKLAFGGLWWCWSRQQTRQMLGASAFRQLIEEVLGGTQMDSLKTSLKTKHHQHHRRWGGKGNTNQAI